MSMWIAGQLIGRIDARWLVGSGLIIAAYSLWQMSHWSLMMGTWPVIVSGLVQGLGMGLIFIRSEEHTSELQSLMRISYAVFCLKKKNTIKHTRHTKRTSSAHTRLTP